MARHIDVYESVGPLLQCDSYIFPASRLYMYSYPFMIWPGSHCIICTFMIEIEGKITRFYVYFYCSLSLCNVLYFFLYASLGEVKDGMLRIGSTQVPVYSPDTLTKVPDVVFYDNPQVGILVPRHFCLYSKALEPITFTKIYCFDIKECHGLLLFWKKSCKKIGLTE